jgi:hypothetical protein
MSATNDAGFSWAGNNRTSVVTSEAAVYNNGEIYNVPSREVDWDPFHGDHSLRFRYPAGIPMAEQRFDLGKAYKDIWFQYWIRVPTNFFYSDKVPNNHKLFALWMDGYSAHGSGASALWEFWAQEDGSVRLALHFSEGGFTGAGGHQQHTDFIKVPEDRGRWMEVTIHVKASSQGDSEDGVMELWRRWANEPVSKRELLHRRTDAKLPLPADGPDGWKEGYFLGWANGSYSETTEWFIDHVTISEEPLIDSPGLGAVANENAPNPPVLKLRQ